MKVSGVDSAVSVDGAWLRPPSVRKVNRIDEVLKHADLFTLHEPLLPGTRHLIDDKRLAAARTGSGPCAQLRCR